MTKLVKAAAASAQVKGNSFGLGGVASYEFYFPVPADNFRFWAKGQILQIGIGK